ncbi:MAG: DUF4886 domain-containing protein [Clostridia bacterium]|nr:DUF4886 domain-containing protein [Clostridia bacterium]
MKRIIILVLVLLLIVCITTAVSSCGCSKKVPKSLKILAIGNSFSVDAMQYLYQIAESAGVKEIVLGNLYIGGCSLERHLKNAKEGICDYKYYKNTNGEWTTTEDFSIDEGIKDEDWDVITMQQSSGVSGIPESYENTLTELIDFVNKEKTNGNAKLFWHMTWAYQQDSTHASFPKYNSDQIQMYNMIVKTVQENVMVLDEIDGIIPNATSIQNARTGFLGDTLTRDGYHLDKEIGRYIAGLCYFAAITGADVSDIEYVPTDNISEKMRKLATSSVMDAVEKPYEITPSKYKK